MDDIDGTGHYERASDGPPPSLLVIVLDTNPYAWACLSPSLTLSKAVADLLVFINAHLAFNHSNRVAVIASHCQRTAWLYPTQDSPQNSSENGNAKASENDTTATSSNPNKYRPFALIEHELLRNLRTLLSTTTESDLLASPTTTQLAGALTLSLSYINKVASSLSTSTAAPSASTNPDTIGQAQQPSGQQSRLSSRVLIVSTSGDLAAQYIPIMNLIFAAQHSRIPIDILKLAGDTVLLQQASYTTSGIFISPPSLPSSPDHDSSDVIQPSKTKPTTLLPTLLFALLPDPTARTHLVPPTGITVDFRAACFCHRRVVDIGFVCSVCLSIFCDEGVALGIQGQNGGGAVDRAQGAGTGMCLTCGTKLSLSVLRGAGGPGGPVSLEPPRKKKKKRRLEGDGVATPASSTPAPE